MKTPPDIKKYIDNNGYDYYYEAPLPCPFCGVVPEVMFIGNLHTKSRKVKIKCPGCHIERTTAVISKPLNWCLVTAIDHWNKRINS